jgi:hypothetical protein
MAINLPKRQATKAERPVIPWLLDSDPSIRWQVMRDMIGSSAEEVAAERARVATEGLGAWLLTPPGGRREVGRCGVEPRVEFHHARPYAVARHRSRSIERPGASRIGPRPKPGNVEGMWPAGM